MDDFEFGNSEFLNMFTSRFGKKAPGDGEASDGKEGEGGKAEAFGMNFDAKNIELDIELTLDEVLFIEGDSIQKIVTFDKETICQSCNGTRGKNGE